MQNNILVENIHRNGGVRDAQEYFGQVDTYEWRCQRSTRIFWSSRYVEMEVSRMHKNTFVEY